MVTTLTPKRARERLARADKNSMLSKAMSRKMQQRVLTEFNSKIIIRKSRRLGVMLEEAEAMKFAEFLNK